MHKRFLCGMPLFAGVGLILLGSAILHRRAHFMMAMREGESDLSMRERFHRHFRSLHEPCCCEEVEKSEKSEAEK